MAKRGWLGYPTVAIGGIRSISTALSALLLGLVSSYALAQSPKEGMSGGSAAGEATPTASESSLQKQQPQWARLLVAAIERRWTRPVGTNGLYCTVHFDLSPTGKVMNATIKTSSGNRFFDDSVIVAVMAASPMPLPNNMADFASSINAVFDPDHAWPIRGPVLGGASESSEDPGKPGGASTPGGTSYYSVLQAKVYSSIQYPPSSLNAGEEGSCVMRVMFARDGKIEKIEFVHWSDFKALNDECRNVFTRIGSFPPVPNSIAPGVPDFRLQMPINFKQQ
jgi:TonB family protein